MNVPSKSPWFRAPKPNPRARLRLFCLPFAGSGASVFNGWGASLPPEIEVWPVQPPGRETRFPEPPLSRAEDYVAQLLQAIRPLLDRPFALFGHSMGGLMAFELARALRREGLPAPVCLLPSGRSAPQVPDREEPSSHLPEPEFIEYLRKLEGTPEEVLANPELRALVFPVLRNDFKLLEIYQHRPEPPLDVPLRVFGGLKDAFIPLSDLEPWREQSRRFLGVRMFPGGHLFLTSASDRPLLLQAIAQDLAPYL